MRRVFRRLFFLALTLAGLACASLAHASATLFLEEPYGKLGFFTATGHAAVYLSDVCAETPVKLRPCAPGETGVVISRYDGVDGYDWVAIPLIPYLYAVDRPEDVPLFADAKMTAFLRDEYRRKYLEMVAPDAKNGEAPGGNWYELVGSLYDRTIYGFEVVTTPAQDAALIEKLNSSANRSHFHTVSRNCADFAKDIINFYYPKSLHRSVIADVGITTPKQMAKMLTKYSNHHPEIQLTRMVIPQVPGSMPRSSAVHGVVESFLKSGKYIVTSAVISPIFAGAVAAVYVGSGAGNFKPALHAKVYVAGGELEPPMVREDIRAYQQQLKHVLAATYPGDAEPRLDHKWEKLQSHAKMEVDDQGRPIVSFEYEGRLVRVGDTASNVLDSNAPTDLVRQLLEARLESELRHTSPTRLAETEVDRDWGLLEQTFPPAVSGSGSLVSAHSTVHPESIRGDQP